MSEPLPSAVRPIDFHELVDRHSPALFRFAISLAPALLWSPVAPARH